MTPTNDLYRIESKVDDLTQAVTKLVLFEERQTVQAISIAALTLRVASTEQKLDMWVNRGIGVWALAVTLFTIYKAFAPAL